MLLNKNIVLGFILTELQKLDCCVLPPLIVQLCWLFLNVVDDKWSNSLVHHTISINGTVIKRTNRLGYVSAFLENIVSSGIHVWKFRVAGGRFVELGIQSMDLPFERTINFGISYQSITRKTYWQRFFPVIGSGSRYKVKGVYLIEMKLNFRKMTLSFSVNDMFRCALNVHCDEYRVVVTLEDIDTEVEILSYSSYFWD